MHPEPIMSISIQSIIIFMMRWNKILIKITQNKIRFL